MEETNNLTYLDTNIILRYLVEDKINSHLSEKARTIFQKLEEGRLHIYTNALVISEAVYVLEDIYDFPRRKISKALQTILQESNIKMENKEKIFTTLNVYAETNIDFEDAFTYVDMLARNITGIYTFDIKHFSKLKGMSVQS